MAVIEYRIFGAPGTGKTTALTNQIQAAARKHGRSGVFVASFTRAAAVEVAGRNDDIPNIGTLHSHGYRAIGERCEVAENHIADWNKENPRYALSNAKAVDLDDVREQAAPLTEGDATFNEMCLNRARLVPRERWKLSVQALAKRWDEWKAATGVIDFMDMIEIPLREHIPLECAPTVGFFDEAQDFTPMELALVRQWGADMEYIVLAGDDDQTIYEWAGASPEVLIGGECAKKVILSQSYRVPRMVHELSQRVIQTVKSREPKEYKPRDADGEVRQLRNVNYNTAAALITDAEQYLQADKTVMILASCSYMIEPVIKELRAAGIPFWNPYRVKAGNWNPLRRAGRGQTSSIEQMLHFVEQIPMTTGYKWGEPMLDIDRFVAWYDIIAATGNIPRGAKKVVLERLQQMKTEYNEKEFGASLLHAFFAEGCGIFDHCGTQNYAAALDWFIENVSSAKARVLEYPRAVAVRRGVDALEKKPQIIVGTIHSVKGGEADVVYVMPDLSRNAYAQKTNSRQGADAVTRLRYVAYTRARESLCLLDAAGSYVM